MSDQDKKSVPQPSAEDVAAMTRRLAELEAQMAAIAAKAAQVSQNPQSPPIPVQNSVAPAVPQTLRFSDNVVVSANDLFGEPAPRETASPRMQSSSAVKRAGGHAVNDEVDFTQLLGIGGVAALVLAAVYLIRLAITSGWMTPAVQVMLVFGLGASLIVAGLRATSIQLRYRSLLPAAGLVMLYIAVFGAHLFYGIIAAPQALVGVTAVSCIALWLGTQFKTDLFALFAVIGSYLVPTLLKQWDFDALGLALYFTAWGVVFSAYAVAIGKRTPYVMALYLGLTLFSHAAWDKDDWRVYLIFQTVQTVLFGAAAAVFSKRHSRPMKTEEAFVLAPALLIFYFLQCGILDRYASHLVVPAAVASSALIVVIYLLASIVLGRALPAAQMLVAGYCSVAFLHAIYFRTVPDVYQPWVAVAAPLIVWALLLKNGTIDLSRAKTFAPALGAAGLIFSVNLLRVVFGSGAASGGKGGDLILGLQGMIFAAELYGAAALTQRTAIDREFKLALVYAGHVLAMAAAVLFLDSRLGVSVAWAVLALGSLSLGVSQANRDLAGSSLLILAASTLKVLLYDLDGSQPVVRIVCLVILGLTLYGAGLLFQRIQIKDRYQVPKNHGLKTQPPKNQAPNVRS
jgi:uncharacterized membrane protein